MLRGRTTISPYFYSVVNPLPMTICEIISFHSAVDANKRAVSTLDIKTSVCVPHFTLVYSIFEHIKAGRVS